MLFTKSYLHLYTGYTKMRLPNLLEHDTIQEASQQAQYWVQLLKTGCSVVSICLFTVLHMSILISKVHKRY